MKINSARIPVPEEMNKNLAPLNEEENVERDVIDKKQPV